MKILKIDNILIYFFIILLSFYETAYSDEFKYTKKHTIEIFDKERTIKKTNRLDYEGIISGKVTFFIKKKNKNEIDSIIQAVKIKTSQEVGSVRNFWTEYLFNSPTSIFKESNDNNFFLTEKRINTLLIKDFKLLKFLNNNKDELTEIRAPLKRTLVKNNFKIPENILRSDHLYINGKADLYWISYMHGYESNSNKNNLEENLSKFHPSIIDSNLKHKIYMDKWINLSLKRHEIFQTDLKIKRKINLKSKNKNLSKDIKFFRNDFYLTDFNKIPEKKEKLEAEKKAKEKEKKEKLEAERKAKGIEKKESSNDVDALIQKIKEINKMYKDGIITEDEYKILKDRLMSN